MQHNWNKPDCLTESSFREDVAAYAVQGLQSDQIEGGPAGSSQADGMAMFHDFVYAEHTTTCWQRLQVQQRF